MSRPTSHRVRSRFLRPRPAIFVAACLAILFGLSIAPRPDHAAAANLHGTTVPNATTYDDGRPVALGVKFRASVAGTVSAIRFFKPATDTGPHIGSIWSFGGTRLATVAFADETESGWQTAQLAEPLQLQTGRTYTVSYTTSGAYVAKNDYFSSAFSNGQLKVEPGGGVFGYDLAVAPRSSWKNTGYFVDVDFTANAENGSGATPTAAPTNSPSVGATATPTTSPTAPSTTPTQPTTSSQPTITTAPSSTAPSDSDTALSLPRVPWDGGPAYWKKFAKTDAAGWDDPSFFPIIAWFNGVSSNAEVSYDKSLGINTYIGMWEGTQYKLFEDNGVFWAGGKLNSTFTDTSKNWVGTFLDDEVDGRFTPAEGLAHLAALRKEQDGTGRFTYANYTQIVMSKDGDQKAAEAYVNDVSDAASLDMYYYTIPYCDWRPYRDAYLVPVKQEYCRTASSYGKAMESLRIRDAADGELKPLWLFIENLNGGPGEGPFTAYITPDQLKGAVMSSIINEARGIAYFNQSHTGPCQGGSIFRQSQTANFCGAAQVAAAKQVNLQVKQLAPVINTQSYKYSFGAGLDTMLKAKDGSIYIFAMVDGESDPGQRTFTLPSEVQGRSVEVLFEDRTITADGQGRFTDNFPRENSYHIYKIAR